MSVQISTRGVGPNLPPPLHPPHSNHVSFPPPLYRGVPPSAQSRSHGVDMSAIRQSFNGMHTAGGAATGLSPSRSKPLSQTVLSNSVNVVQQSLSSVTSANSVSGVASGGSVEGASAAALAAQFDGRRMRMRGSMRRTVDYNVSVVNYLQVKSL